MTYSVEDWSTSETVTETDVLNPHNTVTVIRFIHNRWAVVDLDSPVSKPGTAESEYEMLCVCPTEAKAIWLVHLLNKVQK